MANFVKVIIGRFWNSPEITVRVTHLEIRMDIGIDDYLNALVEEIGNPTMLLTKGMLKTALTKAAKVVEEKVKLESSKAVH